MSNDSIAKTLLVAIGLSLVCSIVVSVAAVGLKPRQEANVEAARRAEILRSAGLLDTETDVNAVFRERVEARVLDLDSGQLRCRHGPRRSRRRARRRRLQHGVAAEERILRASSGAHATCPFT